jgi:hypothetical protein
MLTPTTTSTIIETIPAVLRPEVCLRVWADADTPASEGGMRANAWLTAGQARSLAARLLAAAEDAEAVQA